MKKLRAFTDISEVFQTMEDQKGTLIIEHDDISMETKFISTHFGVRFGTSRLDEKFFFLTSLGFTPC